MFIKKISIQNFRVFSGDKVFEMDGFNVPDGNRWSGLTVLVWENGCWKSSLLEAITLPLISYKADNFSVDDMFNPNEHSYVKLIANSDFEVTRSIRGKFLSSGFLFEWGVRSTSKKKYLSSVMVTDQKYLLSDIEKKVNEWDVDLRTSVYNPRWWKRYDNNEVVLLDENRTNQIRSWTFNSTKFDRILSDFNFQYIHNTKNKEDINTWICYAIEKEWKIENQFLNDSLEDFEDMTGIPLSLNMIENWKPFKKWFISSNKENNQHIELNRLWSGYETLFAILFNYHLALQSEKQLILLIDEPELHLHYEIQKLIVERLLDISTHHQVIIATHSSLLVKQLKRWSDAVLFKILKKQNDLTVVEDFPQQILPWLSANEINYTAFWYASDEFHDELYAYIERELHDVFEEFVNKHHRIGNEHEDEEDQESCDYCHKYYNGKTNNTEYVSLQKYIRHTYHHKDNRSNQYTDKDLEKSILQMIEFIENNVLNMSSKNKK